MSLTNRTAHDTQSLRDAVRLRAARQGRVFRREDLSTWGHDATVVQAMVRKGHWRRIRYGVYVDTDDLRSCEDDASLMHAMECAAAVKALRLPASSSDPRQRFSTNFHSKTVSPTYPISSDTHTATFARSTAPRGGLSHCRT